MTVNEVVMVDGSGTTTAWVVTNIRSPSQRRTFCISIVAFNAFKRITRHYNKCDRVGVKVPSRTSGPYEFPSSAPCSLWEEERFSAQEGRRVASRNVGLFGRRKY